MQIETPIGKNKVELKEWITGRDERDIQRPITSVKLQIGIKGAGTGEIDVGKAMEESKNEAIKKVIVSIDGKTEGILDLVLDMHKKDFEFVMAEVDKVITGDFIKPVSKTPEDGIK